MGKYIFIEGFVKYIDEEGASCSANGDLYTLLNIL